MWVQLYTAIIEVLFQFWFDLTQTVKAFHPHETFDVMELHLLCCCWWPLPRLRRGFWGECSTIHSPPALFSFFFFLTLRLARAHLFLSLIHI